MIGEMKMKSRGVAGGEGGGQAAGEQQKARTPHREVGNNPNYFEIFQKLNASVPGKAPLPKWSPRPSSAGTLSDSAGIDMDKT